MPSILSVCRVTRVSPVAGMSLLTNIPVAFLVTSKILLIPVGYVSGESASTQKTCPIRTYIGTKIASNVGDAKLVW